MAMDSVSLHRVHTVPFSERSKGYYWLWHCVINEPAGASELFVWIRDSCCVLLVPVELSIRSGANHVRGIRTFTIHIIRELVKICSV